MPNFIEPNDFTSRSSILRNHGKTRTTFDPANEQHLASLKTFIETGSWGDVMFFPEYPFTDVPTYVMTKFTMHALGASRKTHLELLKEKSQSSLDIARRNAALGDLVEPKTDEDTEIRAA